MDPIQIGRRIAHARKFAGLRQADLAAEIGVVTRAVQNYEAGVRFPWMYLDKIAAATGRSRAWLAHGDATSTSGAIADDLAAIVRRLDRIEDRLKEVQKGVDRGRFEEVFRRAAED